jgi:glycosyltransferase involved in cell wall biosynthesis
MKIVFATTLGFKSSSLIGRVIPLAEHFSQAHEVHILHLGRKPKLTLPFTTHRLGRLPFIRTDSGKVRLRGFKLLANLLLTTLRTAWQLIKLKPDITIIIKPHPHNVFGVWLAKLSRRLHYLVLDVDDFELTANQLTSLAQRASIHAAERVGVSLANTIVVVSPFLEDRYRHLSSKKNPQRTPTLIPTGIYPLQFTSQPSRPTLTYIGSLSIASGHRVDLLPPILLQVRKIFPQASLLIAGSGDDRSQLQKAFARQKLSGAVTWHGRFTYNSLPALLAQTTLLLDPIDTSLTQRAKSSFRVLLAGITGLPIVTSNVGLRPRLLPPSLHDRFFALPHDPVSYAQKIIELISHPLTLSEQKLLTSHAGQYTWDKLGDQYLSLITHSS